MEINFLFILAFCVILIVLAYFIAKWFYEVAQEKGYHDKKYFWICFWLAGVGIPLVIALPDRGKRAQNSLGQDS